MKLNICIDIDGTITDAYYWLDIANKYFDTNVKPHEVTVYDIHQVLKIPKQDYVKFYEMYGQEIHLNAILREQAKEILWKLDKMHYLYYVTAREEKMKEVTHQWFGMNGLPDRPIHLLGSHYKVDKAKELNCNIFIEDRYENAIQLAQAGFKVLLMDCYYNRHPLICGITRVYNWNDIEKIIQKYNEDTIKKFTKIA
ncbi:5' nucleotidase, NT5C type [Inediibacterium massiliense]|uniref:5' nucleotidase, NT5C type n=1 Tax=Inediibacterium massiliense TaxID=1658111 RepID=UPI0006B45AE1|nr:nucleotidase [Inediibacterium massiliense]